MIRSMTAFGRAVVKTPAGQFLIEIHCLNRKVLDVSLNLPRHFLRFDPALRKSISETLSRGQITVQVFKDPSAVEELVETPSFELLESLKTKWEDLALKLDFDPKEVNLLFLREECRDISFQNRPIDEKALEEGLQIGLKDALEECIKMREKEGAFLAKDIDKRMKSVADAVTEVENLSKDAPQRFQERLWKRFQDAGLQGIADEEKILKEMIVFSEKLDISEEITRLRSHLKQFNDLLKSEEKSIGRALDFLVQEMHREINTIASKSSEVEISRLVIEVKSALEKIREQVQNIE